MIPLGSRGASSASLGLMAVIKSFGLTPVIRSLRQHNGRELQMAGKSDDFLTINDAEGIVTAKRSDGHL